MREYHDNGVEREERDRCYILHKINKSIKLMQRRAFDQIIM